MWIGLETTLKFTDLIPAFFDKSTETWLAIAAIPPFPTIIIFLYVMEKNNVINANYSLLKDRLLKKSWLTTKPFILLTLSMVFIIIASLLLLPGIGYFVYLIHTYLFGITPDIMRLEGP